MIWGEVLVTVVEKVICSIDSVLFGSGLPRFFLKTVEPRAQADCAFNFHILPAFPAPMPAKPRSPFLPTKHR